MAILILLTVVALAIVIWSGRASSLWACAPGILLGLALGQSTAGLKTVAVLSKFADNAVVVIDRLSS